MLAGLIENGRAEFWGQLGGAAVLGVDPDFDEVRALSYDLVDLGAGFFRSFVIRAG